MQPLAIYVVGWTERLIVGWNVGLYGSTQVVLYAGGGPSEGSHGRVLDSK